MYITNGFARACFTCFALTAPLAANAALTPVTQHGGALISDSALNVTWANVASPGDLFGPSSYSAGTALAWVASLNTQVNSDGTVGYGGYTDWTLPTANQLVSLLAVELGNQLGTTTKFGPFTNLNPVIYYYWSSTGARGEAYVWNVASSGITVGIDDIHLNGPTGAMAVRNGQVNSATTEGPDTYTCVAIPEPPGGTRGFFWGINNQGIAVGTGNGGIPLVFSLSTGWQPVTPPPQSSGYAGNNAYFYPEGINDFNILAGGADIYPTNPPTVQGAEEGYLENLATGAYTFFPPWLPTAPYPTSSITQFQGVSNSGLIVGYAYDPNSTDDGNSKGVALAYNPTSSEIDKFGQGYTSVIPPLPDGELPAYSWFNGVNNTGWLVGVAGATNTPRLAFLYDSSNAQFSFLTVPGSVLAARGINDADPNSTNNCDSASCVRLVGWIVPLPPGEPGSYFPTNGAGSASFFVDFNPSTRQFQSITRVNCATAGIPEAIGSQFSGINNSNVVVGDWYDAGGIRHPLIAFPSSYQLPSVSSSALYGGGGSTTNPTGTIAEPINTASGNFYSAQTDLAIKGRGLPFVFNRYYNSLDQTAGPLGYGWTHSYNLSLTVNSVTGAVDVRQQDGSVIAFQSAGQGNYYPVTTGVFDWLSQNADGTYSLLRRNQTVLKFSAAGSLLSVTDRNNNSQVLGYSAAGDLTTITDTVGRVVNLSYDGNHHLLSVVDPINRTVSYGYDSAGHLVSVTDPSGGTQTFTYDSFNRLRTGTDQRGVVYVQNTYDLLGRVTTQVNGRGVATALSYNNPTAGTTTIIDGNGNKIQHIYDTSFRLIQSVDGTGATTRYSYDGNNERTSVTDAKGNVTAYAYDGDGNLVSATDALSLTTTMTYDGLNDLTSIKDAAGNATTLAYDANGNLVATTDALGNQRKIARDTFGEITSVTDPLGDQTIFAWDAKGNMLKRIDAAGRQWTFTYDAIGRRISATDGLGDTATAQYDNVDRLTRSADPLGNTRLFAYDAIGDLVKTTDANANATSYAFDANGKLIMLTDALGGQTAYAYDGNNNLVQVTNARGNATTYTYDAANRLLSITDPLGRVRKVTYDPDGGVTSFTDGNGATSTRSYDVLERLTGIEYADASAVGFAYDVTGNLTRVTDQLGVSAYSYDALHRLIAQQRTPSVFNQNLVGYAYDTAGRRIAATLSTGATIQWSYDPTGRVTAASDFAGHTTHYSYDAAGRESGANYANGVVTEYLYDAASRLTDIQTTGKGFTETYSYVLDKVGNRLAVGSTLGSWSYAYDALYRVKGVEFGSEPMIGYTYDSDGNRLSAGIGPFSIQYTYDAADQLLQAGPMNFAYDGNGSLIRRLGATYSWNAAGRLASVSNAGIQTQYAYDGLGKRLSRSTFGETDYYLYDETRTIPTLLIQGSAQLMSGKPVQSSTSADVFIYGRGLVSAIRVGSQGNTADVEFIHQDALGSIVGVSDATGHLRAAFNYGPWGIPLSPWMENLSNFSASIPFGFTGQVMDYSDGLIYMNARYYDPSVGRFLSRDRRTPRLTDAWDRNPYVYARNNPVTFHDRSGLAAVGNAAPDATGSGPGTPAYFLGPVVPAPPPHFGVGTASPSVSSVGAGQGPTIGICYSNLVGIPCTSPMIVPLNQEPLYSPNCVWGCIWYGTYYGDDTPDYSEPEVTTERPKPDGGSDSHEPGDTSPTDGDTSQSDDDDPSDY